MVASKQPLTSGPGSFKGLKLGGSISGTQDETGSFVDGTKAGHSARQTGWQMTVLIILADTVGTGVLSLPSALAQLGWGVGLTTLLVSVPVFWFAGYLVMHCHLAMPDTRTYGDVGGKLLGTFGRAIGYIVVYTIGFSGMSGYSLVIAQNVQALFYDVHLCLPMAFLIAFIIVFPGNQLRTLGNLTTLAFLSFVALLVVIAIALAYLFSDGAACNGDPSQVGDLDYYSFYGSLGSFVWAYAGVSYYLEMLAEMRRPEDFAAKSGTSALVAATSLYLLTSGMTYARCGARTPDSIVEVIPDGPLKRLASLLIIFHIMVTYAINNQVTVRGFFCATGLHQGLEPGVRGRLLWCFVASVITGLGMLLTMGIPQFDNFNGLVGNFCAAGCMLLPALFFVLMQHKLRSWEPSPKRTLVMALCYPMMLLGLSQLVMGMQGSFHQIYQSAQTDSGRPFTCAAIHP
jgi:vesicular inhibitory amino acid transporter